MTNGAACARLGGTYSCRFRDSRRARIQQDGVSARVKIFLRPGDELAPFLARATVATGRSTSGSANKLARILPALPYVSGKDVCANRYDHKRRPAEHGATLSLRRRAAPL